MKTYKICNPAILAAATFLLPLAGLQTSTAQTNTNLFAATVNLICISTNQTGRLVYERVGTSNFIQECVSEMGVSNLTGLSLVFNRSNSSLEVVSGTNHAVVCTPLSFEGGLSLTNPNNTRVERHTFVFVDTNTMASGLLSATERLTWATTNQLTSFGLRGRLSYSDAANGTNSPAICRGILLVGAAITQEDEDDEDEDDEEDGNGHNGNNGNHGEGNNGNHGQGNNGNHGQGNNGNHGPSGKGKH